MKHVVEEVTLSTGTKGLLIDVPNTEVLDIKVYFRAGYQFGDFSKYEIPHVLEHHVLNATKLHPKNNQLAAEISKNGAVRNAFTGPNTITYWTQCAEFEVERIVDLMVESITMPLFPASDYKTELENVRTELSKNLSDYSRQANMLGFVANYPKLGLMYEDRLGQLDSIKQKEVIGFYHRTHTALNGGFIVAGAVSANKTVIVKALERLFGYLPKGEEYAFLDQPGLGQSKPLSIKANIDSNYFVLGWFAGGGDDNERASYRLLSAILTSGLASRIYGKARDRGLTYHIGSSYDHSRHASGFEFSGFVNPSSFAELLALIVSEVGDVLENGVTQTELDAARDLVTGGVTLHTQTTGAIAGWYGGDYIFDRSILSYEDYFSLLKQTSPDDIQAVAKKLFYSMRHSSSYVGPLTKTELLRHEAVLSPIWQ